MMVALALALVIAVTAGVWYVLTRPVSGASLEASGTVEATDAVLGFAAAGRIHAVHVREGELARVGAVLAELDTSELMARIRQAESQVALSAAQLTDLERGSRPQELEDRRQAVTAASRDLENAERDLARMRTLAASGAVSQQMLDKAQLARDVAATRSAQTRAGLSLAEAGARQDQVAAARAALAAARAQVRSLAAAVPNYFVRAPWSGIVTARAHEPGEAVSAGMAVLSVMNPDDRWVRIYIPEDRVGAVRIGQRAEIETDAFPHRTFAGVVSWIASEAEFTPRNVETKDERVRLVYAAKVRIVGDTTLALKPGTPADVRMPLAPP